MKNLFIRSVNIITVFLLCSTMFASTPLNTKELQVKLELEDVLEQTLTSSISDILKYDRSQFAVDVKIDLLTNTNSGNVKSQPSGALQLEGILPTLPKKSENKAALNNNEYTTILKEVLVYIDSDLYTINASTKIKQHLMTMDWMCEDCILIERQNFPNNKRAQKEPTKVSWAILSRKYDVIDRHPNSQVDKI